MSVAASSEILLWSGDARLHLPSWAMVISCQVYQDSVGKGKLAIRSVVDTSQIRGGYLSLMNSRDLQLEISGVSEPVKVMIVEGELNFQGRSSIVIKPLRTPCWFSNSSAMRAGRLLLVNFGLYWIRGPKDLNFTLEAEGWRSQFIAVGDDSLSVLQFRGDRNFRVTHQVDFWRSDGSSFNRKDFEAHIERLVCFLSFCRGQWVGHSLAAGLDDTGQKSLEQWGTGRVSTWTGVSGWLDEHNGKCIVELYAQFISRVSSEDWLDTLSHAVYWFTRADVNSVGPDGAIILLQAALERLAWQLLVIDRRAISQTGFSDRISTADKLRLLLTSLKVPTIIPDTLAELKAFGLSKSIDGPETLTYIRNRLVHPPKRASAKENLPYYEANLLAQWYVELVILSICGYNGSYGNRTNMGRWKGQVEVVPWA